MNDLTTGPVAEGESETAIGHLRAECNPQTIVAAVYDTLPFPLMRPVQEIVFDLGLTAIQTDILLTGLVIRGYREHQLLFEQRWTTAVLQAHTGEADLHIAAETGLAVRSMHFMLHAHEQIHHVEVLALGKRSDGQTVQARVQAPVRYHTQKTELHFPLRGSWWAIQAADWSDLHKREVFSQPFALDLVKLGPENAFFRGGGHALEEHFSWGEPVYAAAGGKVAMVIYDMPDMPPGTLPDPRVFRNDPRRMLGNAIAVSHANGEFSYYAHLQQASILVSEGQLIRRGEMIGRVGNSGQSPGPHLHLHVMEGPHLLLDQGLPMKLSHFNAGGQFFDKPTTIPTRMIVVA